MVAATWGPLPGGNVSQPRSINLWVKEAARPVEFVPLATCTLTFDLVRTGVVVLVLEEGMEVVGEAVDGETARTIKNVDPMNSTTMINTTLSEG